MTTRNFRVHNGISVGDIVIDASANTITGGATAAPSADGQFSNKKYVDDSIAAISTTAINQGNSSATISDSGSNGTLTVSLDGTTTILSTVAATTLTASGDINLTAGADINIPASKGLTFGDDGEKIEGDGTDLVISASNDLAITTAGALNINNTGLATVSGALTVSGDLTVNGTTTTNNSVNLTVDDNIIELNSGISTSTNDAGIIIERGSTGNNACFLWDESADNFTLGTTTATAGDKSGGISVSVGTLVANLTGTATAAEYSDVAERFASDTAYEAGTVVALGGAAEITQVNEEGSDEVFGVISSTDQAAFMMNGGAGNDTTHPYVAMTGRVNVKVIGSVNKGDRLISASVPGYAKAATKAECTAFNVIGRALTGKTEAGQGSVLAAVRTSH